MHLQVALRTISTALLWTLAAVGVVCGIVFGANKLGLLQPLVVVSGSMEPAVMTGDLILATPIPVTDLSVGTIVSIPSEVTGTLVTHRITEIETNGTQVAVTMKGDANAVEDPEQYVLTPEDSVVSPWFVIPGGGYFVTAVMRPAVSIPLLCGLLAFVALGFLFSRPKDTEETRHDSEPELGDEITQTGDDELSRHHNEHTIGVGR